MTTAATLRDLASRWEAELADLPNPADATTDADRRDREAAVKRVDGKRRALSFAAQRVADLDAELPGLEAHRDKLQEASTDLRRELEQARAKLASDKRPPHEKRLDENHVEHLRVALTCIDHYACEDCGWLGREGEAEAWEDRFGAEWLACPACGQGEATLIPPTPTGQHGHRIPPALLDRLDGLTARPLFWTLDRIAQLVEKREAVIAKVAHLVDEDAVEVAA